LSVAHNDVVSEQPDSQEAAPSAGPRVLPPGTPVKVEPLSLGLASDAPLPRALVWGTLGAIAVLYALLWSPLWYPLSDASMYLNLARGLAAGKDLEWTRQVHKSIRPLTPIVLSWIIRGGGGIGAMHVAMIAFMIVAHVLSFLTLRRWMGERVALLAVTATAISWWTFTNAFSIMTEPLFLVLFWGCLLTLSYVGGARTIQRKWALVLAALVLLSLAWFNRVAAILFLPGILLSLELTNRKSTSLENRIWWAVLYVGVFGLLVLEYKRPVRKPAPGERILVEKGAAGGLIDASDAELLAHTESYKGNVLVGVSNPIVQLPVAGGRWGLEGLMPPLMALYGDKSQGRTVRNPVVAILGALLAVTAFGIMLGGTWLLVNKRAWWPALLMIYFFPIWFMWGTRVKPRYMLPVMPVIVVCLWLGFAAVLKWLFARGETPNTPGHGAAPDHQPSRGQRLTRLAGASILAAGLLANIPTYAIEFYLRHGTRRDFFELARRGGYAELIDIGAYVQKHVPRDAIVYTNSGARRRTVEYLTGRDVAVTRKNRRDVSVKNADDPQMEMVFNRVNGRYAVVFYEQQKWENFHLPLIKAAEETSGGGKYWQLFSWDDAGKKFVPINVPRDRDYTRGVPPKGVGPTGPTTRPMPPKPSATQATTKPTTTPAAPKPANPAQRKKR
jgi:hypothetical protein